MTFQGTPDWQEGIYTPQQIVGESLSTTNPLTVTLPPNCETLAVFAVGGSSAGFLTATGVTSGLNYPVLTSPAQAVAFTNQICVIPVLPAVDNKILLQWSGHVGIPWWVVADAATRVVYDAVLSGLLAPSGAPAPATGLLVGGSDGTDYRALLTDTSGRQLVVPYPPGEPHTTHASFSFTGNGNIVAVSGGGMILYDVTLIDEGAGVVASRVVLSDGFPICQTPGTIDANFHSARGMFIAAGVVFQSVIAAAGTWSVGLNYDQL